MTIDLWARRTACPVPVFFVFLGACAGATAPEADAESASVAQRLEDGAALELEGDRSHIRLAGEVSRARFDRSDIRVLGGELHLRARGRDTLVLESVTASIDDFVVTDVVVSNSLHLTDVRAEIAAPAEGALTWSGDEGYAEIAVDLVASWSLVTESGKVSLAPQTIDDLVLGVTVRAGASDELVAEISAHAEGDVIRWPTVGHVDVLDVELTARERSFADG